MILAKFAVYVVATIAYWLVLVLAGTRVAVALVPVYCVVLLIPTCYELWFRRKCERRGRRS